MLESFADTSAISPSVISMRASRHRRRMSSGFNTPTGPELRWPQRTTWVSDYTRSVRRDRAGAGRLAPAVARDALRRSVVIVMSAVIVATFGRDLHPRH